ncbi:MAG TPA: FAD-dependent oxidoreductase [Euzebyales bacterium]|nr:FAD-dependent oxidoreductase [Euzebyales bacterium]
MGDSASRRAAGRRHARVAAATGAHPNASFWLDDGGPPRPSLTGEVTADVAVVGAGYTGLWTALALTDHDPALRAVILEASRVGHGASGRNGGFVEASLTHGLHNGLAHFPTEIDELLRLGRENFAGLVDDVRRHGIDCDLELTGTIDVATAAWQLDELAESAEVHAQLGEKATLLAAAEVRAHLDSPTYLGGLAHPDGAIVHPGRLARGLAGALDTRGVTIHEGTPVSRIRRQGGRVRLDTVGGVVLADRAVLATNAYSHLLLRRTSRHFVPIYDHILLTEPLTPDQRARIGWAGRQGIADSGNQFHYYRLTADDRILWGGYDAVYRYGNAVGPRFDHRRATYDLLARHFRTTFPQLHDLRFARWWGGPIATTTRFTAAFGEALGGRVVYALGYTGLGVAAARFAGRVLRDRLLVPDSPLLDLQLVSTSPFPFPPEPLRWTGVELTRRAIARSDGRGGVRGPWLRLLDRFGIGFDS